VPDHEQEAAETPDEPPADRDDRAVARPDDGGDVAASRDPDAIAREIEQTRAELADTIDAIADRISPRRAASRGAQAVKAQVSSARGKGAGEVPAESASGIDAEAATPSGLVSEATQSSLPIVPMVTVAAVLLVIVVFLRRRRSR
jgi:hypothetical protein